MARFDNGYSRAVAVTKVILPLIALGILSTLFLLSRPAPQGEPLAHSDLAVLDLAREQRLGAPSYRGVTETGTQIALQATELRPDPEDSELITGRDLQAAIETAGGFGYVVRAREGLINERERLTTLRSDVQITTSNGYEIRTDVAEIASNMTALSTPGFVEATGPIGVLTAGRMDMTGDPETGRGGVVVFKDGVRLVYDPNG